MGYLLPAEYVQYGLTADTTDDWVTMASALIESYCRRPSLLVTQYVERMRLTSGSQAVRLSYRPLAVASGAASALVGVQVRYTRPRRGEMVDAFREQVVWAFGLPGMWTALDPAMVDVNPGIGELTFPVNFFGLDYNEVEVTYTSGLAVIPDAVKVACVQIVKNAQATPSVNIKQTKMDTLWTSYFGSSLIDPQVQYLLKPYVAERLG